MSLVSHNRNARYNDGIILLYVIVTKSRIRFYCAQKRHNFLSNYINLNSRRQHSSFLDFLLWNFSLAWIRKIRIWSFLKCRTPTIKDGSSSWESLRVIGKYEIGKKKRTKINSSRKPQYNQKYSFKLDFLVLPNIA